MKSSLMVLEQVGHSVFRVMFVCLFVWALEIPVMVLPFFRELAQAQEVALVPLYQVLPVEFRHEPGLETNIPNS